MIHKQTCYISVSDLALCQRCPALLAYKIHRNEKSAWKVGINGSGYAYGTIFHKNIAQIFFEGASNPNHELHSKISDAVSGGYKSLNKMIRENIFIPFIEKNSERFSVGQIISMANGVEIWVKEMSKFFCGIPSLIENPAENMLTVFAKPELNLREVYEFHDSRLIICGRYDALMFNPDKVEARLFEFKSFRKSDITVSLSQSLIYSWLIERYSGIIPSVEIIYLDENKKPSEIFNSDNVRDMIKMLPNLFYTAFNIISLKEEPKILRNEKLCSKCKFRLTCKNDINKIFANAKHKRSGAALISVMVFFVAVAMISAQAFFFSTSANDSLKDDRELVGIRMKLQQKVAEAKESLVAKPTPPTDVDYTNFHDKTIILNEEGIYAYDLNYTFNDIPFNSEKWEIYNRNKAKRIFPAMGAGYYLIRAFTKIDDKTTLMYQVLVYKNDTEVITKSFEEIWF
ncbi:MAG: PD-(D/E)XK nuclease family protein [Synergistaceae bacterium]|nr:PD-(D/E)XK nuclease family protein [Synergistaceae bacterium]